ncbi:hypothetical protein MMC21_007048 [Puttea exsequens]|nr:hypothetical protein [Puttea exsequens]
MQNDDDGSQRVELSYFHPDVEWRFKREIGKNWILFEEYKDDFEEHYQYYNHDLGADRRIGR